MSPKPRPPRASVTLSDLDKRYIDEARGGTPISRYMREAALARAAYELGQRSAEPGRTLAQIIERLRAR